MTASPRLCPAKVCFASGPPTSDPLPSALMDTSTWQEVPVATSDAVFCAGHTVLESGDVVVVGGHRDDNGTLAVGARVYALQCAAPDHFYLRASDVASSDSGSVGTCLRESLDTTMKAKAVPRDADLWGPALLARCCGHQSSKENGATKPNRTGNLLHCLPCWSAERPQVHPPLQPLQHRPHLAP